MFLKVLKAPKKLDKLQIKIKAPVPTPLVFANKPRKNHLAAEIETIAKNIPEQSL